MKSNKIIAVFLIGAVFTGALLAALPVPARDSSSEESSLSYFDRKRLAVLKSIIAKNLPRNLSVKKMDTFLLGLRGAEITGFKMTENESFLKEHPYVSDPVFLKAKRIIVRINPLMLFLGQVYIREMTIEEPVFQVVRDKEGSWNFDDLTENQDSKLIKWLRVENLTIKNARYEVLDHGALNSPASSTIRDVDVTVRDFTIGEVFNLDIKAASPGAEKQNFFMRGQAGPMEIDQKNDQIPLDVDLNIVDLPILAYNRYAFPADSPVLPDSGRVNLDFHLTGDAWSGMTMTGRLRLEDLVFRSTERELRGAPLKVDIGLKQPLVLSLENDRLAMPLLEMVVNGNSFYISGDARELRGLSEASLEVVTGDVDLDVIQSIYPFFTDSLPEQLELGGHLDMNVRLAGNQSRARVTGQLDLTELRFGFGDYFFKPPRQQLVMNVDSLVSTAGIIKGRGTFTVERCLLGNYNFIEDLLSRLLPETGKTALKQQILADYGRLPHMFDAVEGTISYAEERVLLERIQLSNLAPRNLPGIDGVLEGYLDTGDQTVNVSGQIRMLEDLTRRVVAIDPGVERFVEDQHLLLGFQHTGKLQDLTLEIFQKDVMSDLGDNRVKKQEQP